MPHTKHVHLSFIINEIGDQEELIDGMLSSFSEVLHEFNAGMQSSISEGNLDNIRLHVHKIKPSLKMFNSQLMLNRVLQIERIHHAHSNFEQIEKVYSDIDEILPTIFSEISQLRKENKR